MNFIHIATFIAFLLCGVHQAMSGTVKAITKNIEAIVNTTVELSWRVEPNKAGETLFGVQLYEGGVVVISDLSGTVTEAGKNKFGGRLSASIFLNNIYKMFIKKIQYNEAKSFTLIAVFSTASSGIIAVNDTASIISVKDPRVNPPPSDKKKDNTGVIVGVVVSLLIIIAIVIVVVLFLRRRREQLNKSGEGQQLTSVQTKQPRDEMPQYAQPSAAMSQDNPKQVYAEVNRSGGGGRDGPRPDNLKTDYAQMKVDADGYPATGPTSGVPDSPKPEKPVRGIPRHSAE